MSEPVLLKAELPYLLTLHFTGFARYAIQLFTRKGAGSWRATQIEEDASSEDYRLDAFELDALARGEDAVLRIAANLCSPLEQDTVKVTAELSQGPGLTRTASREAVLNGQGFVWLHLRIPLRAE